MTRMTLCAGALVLIGGAGLANTSVAVAQESERTDASSKAPSAKLEEVLVSAARVGEVSLQETPMAISVISPTALDSKGQSGVSDFLGELPSVNMQSSSPGINSIDMRGLVTDRVNTANLQKHSLVAMYLDDTSIGQQGFNPDLHIYDLDRIEVIRGPQGTLYGAGSMAGTIRLITKAPDPTRFFGSSDVSVSETTHGGTNTSARGMVNLPIIDDRLAARLVLYRSDDDGYIDNISLNRKNANPVDATQGRLVVRWLPTDNLTIDASATLARLKAHGGSGVYPQLSDYTFQSLSNALLNDDFKLYNVTADWDLGFASLVSSSSYTPRTITNENSAERIVQALLLPQSRIRSTSVFVDDIDRFQQEIRLVSKPDQALRWIVGAYYQRDTRENEQTFLAPGFDGLFGARIGNPNFSSTALYGTPAADELFYGTIHVAQKQSALFGEATYSISPKLDVTLGARYFDFTNDYRMYFTGVGGAISQGVPNTAQGQEKADGVNPRGVVSFKVNDDLMVYAEAARGFRYGGVNNAVPVNFCQRQLAEVGLARSPATFGPDHLWSFTLGEKGTFADGRVVMNVNGFYIKWDEVQTTKLLTCGYNFTQNSGKIKSQGVEVESKMLVTQDFTVGLSGSLTDATTAEANSNLKAAKGDRVPFFPRTIVTVNGQYDVFMPQAKLAFSADYTYRSNQFTDFSPLVFSYAEIPSSVQLNASIEYTRDNWSVSLFGTNLTDNKLINSIAVNTYGAVQPGNIEYWGRPRTIGLHGHLGF